MKCLIFVKFLPGGSLPPAIFLSRLNARWGHIEEGSGTEKAGAGSAICVADYESIEQLALDLSIMPGAGIASIEVVPLPDNYPAPEGDYAGIRRLTYGKTGEMVAPTESQQAGKSFETGR
jgi:hypothetical protein